MPTEYLESSIVVESKVARYLVKEIIEDRFEGSLEAKAILCKSLDLETLDSRSLNLVDVAEVDPDLIVPVTVAASAYLAHGGLVSAVHYLAGLLYLDPDGLQVMLAAKEQQMQALALNLNLFLDGWNELKLGKYRLPLEGQIYVRQ